MIDEQKPREPLSPESISFLAKFIADDLGGKAWELNQSLAKAIANGWTVKASGGQAHESSIVPRPDPTKAVPCDGPALCSLGAEPKQPPKPESPQQREQRERFQAIYVNVFKATQDHDKAALAVDFAMAETQSPGASPKQAADAVPRQEVPPEEPKKIKWREFL